MSLVLVEYLQADGRYRHRRASIETRWPNFSLNRHDKQAHDLIDNPIFPIEKKPGILRSWQELRECPAPRVLRQIDKVMMVCEDNSIWPVSLNTDPDPDDRQMSRKDHFEEGFQYAKAAATRESMGNPFLTAWSVVGMIVFAIASVLIALFFVQIKFGDKISEEFQGASAQLPYFLTLLGAIATLDPTSKQGGALKRLRVRFARFKLRFHRKPRVKKERKPDLGPLERVYILDELSARTFTKLMPLYVLAENLPVTCRYTYDPGHTKWIAAGLGAAIGFGLLFVSLMFAYGQIMGMVYGLLIGMPAGAIFGFFGITPFMLETPIWVVRRLHIRLEDRNIDYDALPDVYPEEHTHLMGLPVPVARDIRLALANSRGLAAATAAAPAHENGAISQRERSPILTATPAMMYNPTVHRATTLYEEIEQRDFREQFKGGMSTMQKVQIGSFMVIAVCSVGLLVFLIMIT